MISLGCLLHIFHLQFGETGRPVHRHAEEGVDNGWRCVALLCVARRWHSAIATSVMVSGRIQIVYRSNEHSIHCNCHTVEQRCVSLDICLPDL